MKTIILYFVAYICICFEAIAQEPIKIKVEETMMVTYRSYKNIYFDKDSIEIRKYAFEILNYLSDILKNEFWGYSIQIEGFVDSVEFTSKPYLALQRAKAVKDYFVKKGIAVQRIIVKDGGKAEIPKEWVEEEEEEEVIYEMMRRVTFSLVKKE